MMRRLVFLLAIGALPGCGVTETQPAVSEPLLGEWDGVLSVGVQDSVLRCTSGGCSGTTLALIECPAVSTVTEAHGLTFTGVISVDETECEVTLGDNGYVQLGGQTSFRGIVTTFNAPGEALELDFDLTLDLDPTPSAFPDLFGCPAREPWVIRRVAEHDRWWALYRTPTAGNPGVVNDISAQCAGRRVYLAARMVFQRGR